MCSCTFCMFSVSVVHRSHRLCIICGNIFIWIQTNGTNGWECIKRTKIKTKKSVTEVISDKTNFKFHSIMLILRLIEEHSYVFVLTCCGAVVLWFLLLYAQIEQKWFPPSTQARRFWRGNISIQQTMRTCEHCSNANIFPTNLALFGLFIRFEIGKAFPACATHCQWISPRKRHSKCS